LPIGKQLQQNDDSQLMTGKMSSAGKANSANKDEETARKNFEVQISLANETPYFHAALLESLLQSHLLVNSSKAKFKCL